jgi:S-layer protein
MYIFKSNSSDGVDEKLSKPSSTGILAPLADTNSARILNSALAPTQTVALAGLSAPTGLMLNSLLDSIATAALVSNVAMPLTSDFIPQAANEDSANALVGALQAFSKMDIVSAPEASNTFVPITSLSDSEVIQGLTTPHSAGEALVTTPNVATLPALTTITELFVPTPLVAPVLITDLTDTEITVINNSSVSVHVSDVAPQANIVHYVNTGSAPLIVFTTGTHLTSLTLAGPIVFTASADEISTGITVSAIADTSDITLYLVSGASAQQGGSDVIHLGDGNNFILDAGDGQVAFSFGSGTNVVMLTGVGVNGKINFAHHGDTVGEFVSVASNGVSTPSALASNPLITISGLNNAPQSIDTITFLGDPGASLVWAGKGAGGAQVITPSGEAGNLANWISAAQNKASAAHSVAWFQFDGDTYVLESAAGRAGQHVGDTLVRLTGVTQFSGTDSELSFGVLHLAG